MRSWKVRLCERESIVLWFLLNRNRVRLIEFFDLRVQHRERERRVLCRAVRDN